MKKWSLVPALIIFIFTGILNAQVVVNPVAIFFDPLTKTAEAEIKNISTKPLQVELGFEYMYENWIDSLGKVTVIKKDSIGYEKYALDKYIKVFPRKMLIPPGKSQTVRLLLMNVGNLEDGTYWTRLVTKTEEQDKLFDTTGKNDDIGSKFKIHTGVSQPVIYQKGKVFTGVDITRFERVADIGNMVVFKIELERTGNSPFWGSIGIRVVDESNDKIVGLNVDACPVFFKQDRTIGLEKKIFSNPDKNTEYTLYIDLSNENMKMIPEDRRYNKINIGKSFTFKVE